MLRDKWQGRREQEPRVIRFGADASFSTGVEEEVLVHEGCSLREVIQGVDAGLLVLRSTLRRCRGIGHDGRPAGMAERFRVI